MKAEIRVLSQHARRGHTGFSGPDTYVAVIYTEKDDVEFPKYLNRKLLEKRGIGFEHCGEGYHEHRGPKSALGKAIKRAETFLRALEVLGIEETTGYEAYSASHQDIAP